MELILLIWCTMLATPNCIFEQGRYMSKVQVFCAGSKSRVQNLVSALAGLQTRVDKADAIVEQKEEEKAIIVVVVGEIIERDLKLNN